MYLSCRSIFLCVCCVFQSSRAIRVHRRPSEITGWKCHRSLGPQDPLVKGMLGVLNASFVTPKVERGFL